MLQDPKSVDKKKIAVIGLKGLPAFGGAASVGEALIDELKKDYDFFIYSISTHTDKSGLCDGFTQIVFKGSKINGINTFKYFLKSLIHCMFFAKYDLIHLHHTEGGFITPFLKLKYRIILTLHGIYANKVDPKYNKSINLFFRFSERMNIRYTNRIVSVSKSDKVFCENYYKRFVEYIPNGVKNIIPSNTSKNKSYKLCFAAARVYEIKGLHILLKAIKLYKIEGKLLVIGDLNQQLNYKDLIMELAIGLDIEFVPLLRSKDKLYDYISRSELFVFPSIFEAMPMTLLEVVCLKIPILASNIEANQNIFTSDELTYFNSGDARDLADKFFFCMNNPHLIEEKTEKAYKKVFDNFRWTKIARQYSTLYNELMNGHK